MLTSRKEMLTSVSKTCYTINQVIRINPLNFNGGKLWQKKF